MLSLEVYTKNKPVANSEALEKLGLIQEEFDLEKPNSQLLYYVWTSKIKIADDDLPGPEHAYIEVLASQVQEPFETYVNSASLTIPLIFHDILTRNKKARKAAANSNSYKSGFQIKNVASELSLLWRIFKLASGEPNYETIIRAPVWGPAYDRSIQPTMRKIAGCFADNFDGIVCKD